jgi:hypothetical protein
MTFAVWNFGINAQNSCLIWFGNSANVRILSVHIPWGDNTLYFDAGDGSGNNYDRISKVPTASEYQGWNYWTFIKNSTTGTMKIFRNGEEWHANTTFLSRPIGAASGSAFLCFGPAAGVGFDVYHRGRIGMVKLYNRQLSASEIRENYNATKGRYDTTRSSDAIKPRLSTSGLVLHLDAANYRSFVSGSTTWRDLSGNGFNGTLTNGPTYSSANNGSIVFDGTNDYVLLSDSDSLSLIGDMTICAWINVTDRSLFNGIISKTISNIAAPFDFYLYQGDGVPRFLRGNGTVFGSSDGFRAPALGVWQHVAVTMSGTNVVHYLNSNVNNSNTLSTTIADNNGGVYIGYRADGGTKMKGSISNIMLYNRALSAVEISQHFNYTKGRYGYVL